MNNNTPAIIRSLIIYAICIPLAVWVGFMLTDPFNVSTFSYAGILALVLLTPILLRWHYLILVATWNLGITIFFLPGDPPIWLLTTALSLGIAVLHRTVNHNANFISAPSITRPLVFFLAVVVVTCQLTGGIGLHSLGNDTAGGKFYVLLVMGILSYFALTTQRIPPQRVRLYVSLFFLAGCTAFISDLAPYLPSSLYFIFSLFPANGYDIESVPGILDFHARFAGFGITGLCGFMFMMSRYGIREIFLSGRLWRPVLFGMFVFLLLLGGFRSNILFCGGVFVFQFFMERVHRTRMFPAVIFAGIMGICLLVPFANKLPFAAQRALAFLPLNLDRNAVQDAQGTADWRLQIWKDMLPTVPQYLLLGKGYAISQNDLNTVMNRSFHYVDDAQSVDIAGGYHSGPLSVVIPFGIWGVIAIFWFWIASIRALYLNYRYGDAEYRTTNIFLLAYFISKILLFLIVVGGLFGDMYIFAGIIGLSVSINGGIRSPVAKPSKPAAPAFSRPRLHAGFQR